MTMLQSCATGCVAQAPGPWLPTQAGHVSRSRFVHCRPRRPRDPVSGIRVAAIVMNRTRGTSVSPHSVARSLTFEDTLFRHARRSDRLRGRQATPTKHLARGRHRDTKDELVPPQRRDTSHVGLIVSRNSLRMPSNSPRNAVARHWELLKRLPSSPPGKTTSELTLEVAEAGYQVTKRTIERDLEGLEDLFPISHGDAEPFGWHWVKGSAFGVMGLSTADALSLHLLERHLKPILPAASVRQLQPVFSLAGQKLLAQRSSNALSSWADKMAVVEASLAVLPCPIDAAALQLVQECLLADEQVEIDYVRPGTQEPRARILHPLGLVQCGAITYFVATTQVDKAPQTFALHRVRSARRLHLPAARPDGFSLQTFIAQGGLQFGATRDIDLEAWVSSMLGAQLIETRLCDNQLLTPADDG